VLEPTSSAVDDAGTTWLELDGGDLIWVELDGGEMAEMASSWVYLIMVELDGGAGGGTGGGAGGEEAYLPSLPPGASWLHAERRRSASLAAAIRRAASCSTASRPS
jgi:hypothetical protein